MQQLPRKPTRPRIQTPPDTCYADDILRMSRARDGSRRNQGENHHVPQHGTETHLISRKNADIHAHTGKARFLGYEIGIMHSPTSSITTDDASSMRAGLYIPEDVMQTKRKRYLRDGCRSIALNPQR